MGARSDQIAVLLNANAKSVGRRTVDTIRETLPRAHTFLSRNRDDAQRHVDRIVHDDFGLVLCGGGDGSVVTLMNLLRRRAPTLPRLGLLKLGTGNAWARAMGARGLRWTLEQLQRTPIADVPSDRFDLVEVEGMITHFTGAGWDARLVNDFNDLMRGVGLKAGKSVVAYMTALFSRTVPAEALEFQRYGQAEVEVETLGGDVVRVTRDGSEVPLTVEPGTVIHAGPVSVIGCATTEHYGFGFKAFPYARRRTRMFNFRALNMSIGQAVVSIPALWRGTMTGEPITDYLVHDIQVTFSRPLEFQVGGDAMGKRHQVRMRIADESVEIVDFKRLSQMN